jgi:hypothetical protein
MNFNNLLSSNCVLVTILVGFHILQMEPFTYVFDMHHIRDQYEIIKTSFSVKIMRLILSDTSFHLILSTYFVLVYMMKALSERNM